MIVGTKARKARQDIRLALSTARVRTGFSTIHTVFSKISGPFFTECGQTPLHTTHPCSYFTVKNTIGSALTFP